MTLSMKQNLMEKMNMLYLVGLNGTTLQILDLGTFSLELRMLDLNNQKILVNQEIEHCVLGKDQDTTTSQHLLATKKINATIT